MKSTVLFAFTGIAFAAALPADPSISSSPSSTQEPCAQVSSYIAGKPDGQLSFVPAELGMQCLTSVPLSKDNDTLLVEQLVEYINFQTTLTYLKNPPSGYSYGSVDIIANLEKLGTDLQGGTYSNEYAFQADLVKLFESARDGHFYYRPDIINQVLSFNVLTSNNLADPSYLSLDSVSVNGTSLPEIYVHTDILAWNNGGNSSSTLSPVTAINGVDVQEALNNSAATANNQDPDANYNYLLHNQAIESSNYPGANYHGMFADGVSYYGNQTVLDFANGTQRTYQNVAGLLHSFKGIQSGADVFQRFCSGQQSATASNATSTASAPASTATQAKGYPMPITIDGTSAVSGYLLNSSNSDVAILSINSFLEEATDTASQLGFSTAVSNFLKSATQAGKQKLVIDMRGNPGGVVELAYDTFKQLFPTIEPYGATRIRAHEAYDLLGNLASSVSPFSPNVDPSSFAVNPLINYQVNVNANNSAFSSWSDFYGPDTIYGDNFTSLFRQNLTNMISTNNFTVSGYGSRSNLPSQPFKSENIVMLTDGICGSACAVFSEFMKEQGKVKSIAIGGRPQTGPMQAVGASKGARLIQFNIIWSAVYAFASQLSTADLIKFSTTSLGAIFKATQPITRTNGGANGAVNGLNNYRMNDSTQTPLQFVYEAADCRLFYTPAMIQNVTNVWNTVAKVQWANGTAMCVAGSTNGKGSLSSGNTTVPGTPINNATVFSGSGSSGQPASAASGLGVPAVTACLLAVAAAFVV